MRWHGTLLVALLLVTAGCSGFADGGSDTATESEVTPAPVPSPATPTATPDTAGDVEDDPVAIDRLAADHQDALANRSYTFREEFETTTTVDGETTTVQRSERTMVAGPQTYRHELDRRRTAPNGSVENYTQSTYGDGGRWFERRDDGTVTYHEGDIRFSRDEYAAEAAFYLRQYATFSGNTTRRIRWTGATRYRSVGGGGDLPTLNKPRDYRVSILVEPDGLVRWFGVRYTVEVGNRTETVEYRFWYEQVNTTAVDRPSWVENRTESRRVAAP